MMNIFLFTIQHFVLYLLFVYLVCGWCEDLLCILPSLLLPLNTPKLQTVDRLDGVGPPLPQGHHHPPHPGPAPAAVHHHPQLQEEVEDQESHRKPDNLLLHTLGDAEIFKPVLIEKLPNTNV